LCLGGGAGPGNYDNERYQYAESLDHFFLLFFTD